MSGCSTAAASRSTTSRKPQRVICRSPTAIGTGVARATPTSASTFSQWQGSSANSSRYGSSSRSSTRDIAGLSRRCRSMAMSTPSPTSSRTAATARTVGSMPAGGSRNRHGLRSVTIFSAVKP